MRRIVFAAVVSAVSMFVIAGTAAAQNVSRPCVFDGTYRIDVDESDRLYSVVRGATSSVPFSEQQQFFMDLSVRLTPPDILAIECRGPRVSVGSSRARKITFIADGAARTERSSSGSIVRSTVAMAADTLTFTSSGRAEDSVNVAFRALDGGRRLEVTRRINATQLSEPIVIRSVYDRVAGGATWDARGDIAGVPDTGDGVRATAGVSTSARHSGGQGRSGEAADLRNALNDWIGATNKRDIDTQMRFYLPQLDAYYLSRNTPRSAVMSEKRRVFSTARSIDIRAEVPEIVFQDSGRTAVMRFNKKYRIADKGKTKSGEVVQELRWRRTGDGWRIYSERDVKVLR